jgi:hypothetical protein
LKIVWALMCGLAGIGFLASLFIKDYPLDRFVPAAQAVVAEEKVEDNEKDAGVVGKASVDGHPGTN